MSTIRCPHCGTANRAGSNFCNGCGTDLRDNDAPSYPAAVPPQRTPVPWAPVEWRRPSEAPEGDDDEPDERAGADAGESAAADVEVGGFDEVGGFEEEAPSGFDDSGFDSTESPSPSGTADDDTDPFAGQPWLHLEFDAEEDDTAGGTLEEDATIGGASRLVTGIQGLLNPIRIAGNIEEPAEGSSLPPDASAADVRAASLSPAGVSPPGEAGLSADESRIIRGLMAEPPTLSNRQSEAGPHRLRSLRISWIFVLVGMAVALPALIGLGGPIGRPNAWPGVNAAYQRVQAVAPETVVHVFWAYDPSTAGELDLAMQPVMRHLLEQRARIGVVSLLPGGVASARRLVAQVRSAERSTDLGLAADLAQPITYAYLPGGSAILPLLARQPVQALLEEPLVADEATRRALEPRPTLTIIAAGQAEDVQAYLEQVQPLSGAPVVAVTAAGADPILRPYLDSGQLQGLVSGFDGGYTYQRQVDPFAAPDDTPGLTRHLVLQNWGHIALLACIVLGNLAALVGRESNS